MTPLPTVVDAEKWWFECRELIDWLFGGDVSTDPYFCTEKEVYWFVWYALPQGPVNAAPGEWFWRECQEQVGKLPSRWGKSIVHYLLSVIDQAMAGKGICGLGAVRPGGESMRITVYSHEEWSGGEYRQKWFTENRIRMVDDATLLALAQWKYG